MFSQIFSQLSVGSCLRLRSAGGCSVARYSHSLKNRFLLPPHLINYSDPEFGLAEDLDCPAQCLSAVSDMS